LVQTAQTLSEKGCDKKSGNPTFVYGGKIDF